MELNNPASISLSYELVQDTKGSTTIMENNSSDAPGDATSEGGDETKQQIFRRSSSSFMRVSDLHFPQQLSSQDDDDDEKEPHYHHASDQPPPGMTYEENETWIALDDGVGSHAPVAPFAIDALFERGLKIVTDEQIWIPDKATKKLLKGGALPLESEAVLIWTSEKLLSHGVYGYDIPAVRSRGYVHMSPESLISLLVDSSRVQEYNKLSLGRTDEIIFNDNLHVSTGNLANVVTKIVKSSNKPPLIPKILQFCTLLHCRKITRQDHGVDGFIIVSRAVTSSKASTGNVLESEILLGVNLITRVDDHADWSVLTNVNHMKSPMVPGFIARRVGLSAAVSFIQDIRALC